MTNHSTNIKFKFKKMFRCDKVEIIKTLDKLFLIIGFKKNTKDTTTSFWRKDGKRIDFSYYEREVVASGGDHNELLASAKEYKRLQGISMLDYLREKLS